MRVGVGKHIKNQTGDKAALAACKTNTFAHRRQGAGLKRLSLMPHQSQRDKRGLRKPSYQVKQEIAEAPGDI